MERLSNILTTKIESFNTSEPYVWKLKLTAADFNELEDSILKSINAHGGSKAHLQTKEWALAVIIYLAEWYKRCYASGNTNDKLSLDSTELQKVWENSGINPKHFVYRDDNGNRRWLYSIYVLGGLAIQHELGRGDNRKFLKTLCRIYHGEDVEFGKVDDINRAVAFRESIKREHSLYGYLHEILNGNMPFADEEVKNTNSDVSLFIQAVKLANDEVFRDKYSLEWVIDCRPDSNYMRRYLRLCMKPEEVGGGMHQYLRYDRVHLWGMAHPEQQRCLRVSIRYMEGMEVVEPANFDHPLITYVNTGENETGFLAFGVERIAVTKNIPTKAFDTIEIVLRDDNEQEYIVQRETINAYMQMWREEDFGNKWTSRQLSQKDTALVFSSKYALVDKSLEASVERRRFHDKTYGNSAMWNWIPIHAAVTICDDADWQKTFYNLIGYELLTTRAYNNIIRYEEGGKVKHRYIEDPYMSDRLSTEYLPLIFGWEDVIAEHFASKTDIEDGTPDADTKIELIEYKQSNGHFIDWNVQEPAYGALDLRVSFKNKRLPLRVMYLPRLDAEKPVNREYYSNQIIYMDVENGKPVQKMYQDTIPMNKRQLKPVIELKIGNEQDFVMLEVYRPTLIKEVCLDGKIVRHLQNKEEMRLPYIFKNRAVINDFSEMGYRKYACASLGSLYTQDFIDIKGNPSSGLAALAAWNKSSAYKATLLDAIAPEYLYCTFGNSQDDLQKDGKDFFFWDYNKENEPELVDPEDKEVRERWGLVFQNESQESEFVCNYPIFNDDDLWEYDEDNTSIVKCFDVANEKNIYFFIFMPLRELERKDYVGQIYEPLLESRDGELTDVDKSGLLRFAEEFNFDWAELGVNIEME